MTRRPSRTRVVPLAAAGLLALAAPAVQQAGARHAGAQQQAAQQAAARQATAAPPATGLPAVDPGYIYAQLAYLATHFQHREAGYAAGAAGHAGFARYWTRQMLGLLGRYGARARSIPFPVRGWLGRPATAPAANVEVTIPGLSDPAHEVVIGCHYDGEADSTESANDDASGCAIELGVARAMAAWWRAHHSGPARTLRFVLFDAEEQGIFGSFDYVNTAARNDLGTMTAMINEEQNGIAYPLRYLGRAASPLMPLFAFISPLTANGIYQGLRPAPSQQAATRRLQALVRRAVPAAFRRFRAMGDQMLTYHRRTGPDSWQPVFTPAQAGHVRVLADTIGSSDQVPFTEAGVPAATFVGNSTYYQRHPPPGSYPFDQPQDTIALMNTFADGGQAPSHALALALALPAMLSCWLLAQPAVLGQSAPDGRPAAAIGDIGVVLPGQRASFAAAAGYLPGSPGARLRYAWSFGDGAAAAGPVVRHAYRAPGTYTLRLRVQAGAGWPRVISRRIVVGPQRAFGNPYARVPSGAAGSFGRLVARGLPPANPAARLPSPAPGRRDQVGTVAQARRLDAAARRAARRAAPGSPLPWVLGGAGAAALLGATLTVGLARSRRRRATARRVSPSQ